MKNNQYSLIDHLKFIVPSLVGVFLFMLPIKTEDGLTIPIAILADSVQTLLTDKISGDHDDHHCRHCSHDDYRKNCRPEKFTNTPFFQQLFLRQYVLDDNPNRCCHLCYNGIFPNWTRIYPWSRVQGKCC